MKEGFVFLKKGTLVWLRQKRSFLYNNNMSKLQRKKDYLKKLPKIVEALKKGYKPKKIILFGSMLDPQKPSNDIDLLIIKDGVDRAGRHERSLEAMSNLSHEVPMDVLVYSPKEIEKRLYLGDPFIKDIIENGKVLYGI